MHLLAHLDMNHITHHACTCPALPWPACRWTDGYDPTFLRTTGRWLGGEPNGGTANLCLEIWRDTSCVFSCSTSLGLDDRGCGESKLDFVCSIKPPLPPPPNPPPSPPLLPPSPPGPPPPVNSPASFSIYNDPVFGTIVYQYFLSSGYGVVLCIR